MNGAATVTVAYGCGCRLERAGQSFAGGLLVCPEHGAPVAPYERPSRPARATVELRFELAGDDGPDLLAALERTILADPRTDRLLISTLEQETL